MRKVKWARLLGVVMTVLTVWLCFAPAGAVFAADGDDKKTTPTPTPIQDYVNKDQYLTGYYRGYVTQDNSAVREGPGTKTYPILKLDDGTEVKLQKGTEVFVYGETKDIDLDVWYHIKGTFKNQEFEGYLYIKRINRENTQIKFTPAPTPSPLPTPTTSLEEPTKDPGKTNDPSSVSPAPTSNISDIGEKSKKGDGWKLLFVFCIVVIVLIIIYTIFQRVQEKKLEEEMERYSKRRPAMERLDGEDEEDFKEAKKKYYASMNLGHPNSRKPKSGVAKPAASYDDDNLDDDFDDLDTKSSSKSSKSDYFDDEDFTDEDVKVVNDFRAKGHSKAADDFDDDFSEDDHAYFNRLKGKTEAPSENAIKKAGSAASILDEAPNVDSYFEADEPTREEHLRNALDALKPEDSFVHKLYGEGVVIDNSDSEIIQVRFGRDLRFLKKDKIAKKELIDL